MSDVSAFATAGAASIVIKVTVLLMAALVIQQLLRRRSSAAARHAVLTLAVGSVLLLPAVALVAPEWGLMNRTARDPGPPSNSQLKAEYPIRVAQNAKPDADAVIEPSATSLPATPEDITFPLLVVYAAGAAAVMLHLLLQTFRSRSFLRSTTDVNDEAWRAQFADCATALGVYRAVSLRRSREQTVPLAIGVRKPTIVIPAIADTWDEGRRRAVLLHELAHVARHDCLTQTVAALATAAYWFHPAMWWVARQLRVERELACDDLVIAAGAGGREYAGHLLEIAYSTGGGRSLALAVGMARRSQLEGRLLAAIDDTRNRRVPRIGARAAAVAVATAAVVGIAGARAVVDARSDSALDSELMAEEVTPFAAEHQNAAPTMTERVSRIPARIARAAQNVARNLQDNLPGTWEIRPTTTDGVVHLRMVELNSSSGTNIPLSQLEGLTAAQLAGSGGPVQFRIRRDAGTFSFEGVFRSGVGAGTFSFAPDANFPAEMAKRGFAQPSASEQYQLARYDIGFAFVDELNRQGYGKPQTSELVVAGQHGVHITYLREMGALGYRLGTLQPLITLRDHGVTPEYVRQLADLGYKNLSADQVRNARDHGVTPDYVRGMREAGYGSQTLESLIITRDHGVTPDYVRALDQAGYRKLALEDVVRVRDHGVSPDYIRDMHQLGFKVPVDELVRARDHGVDPEYIRGIAAVGYGNQPLDALIRLRDHGVTADFAKGIKALGYDGLSLDDLISLRDHGVTPDKIKRANDRAGTRLPIDMLRSLAAGGMR